MVEGWRLDFGDFIKIAGFCVIIVQAWFRLGAVEDDLIDLKAEHDREVALLDEAYQREIQLLEEALTREIGERNRRIDNVRDRLQAAIDSEDYSDRIHAIELSLARSGS